MKASTAAARRSFVGWTPIHYFRGGVEPAVLWSRLGRARFEEPFFAQTISAALAAPLPLLLQRTTSLEELVAAAACEPAVEPAGFIFHVSRCGSTLLAQMFARLPRLISISEAQPIATAVDDPRLSPADRVLALRALVRLYSRAPSGAKTGTIFKFTLRELFGWREIVAAFPEVPRVVLSREPLEVLVSNLALASEATLPGLLAPEILGPPPRSLLSQEDYAAFVLSRAYACAAELARLPGSLAVDYRELPGAAQARIAPHFGLALEARDRAAWAEAALLYAKDAARQTAFTPDSATKQAAADDSARTWAAQHFRAPYQEFLQLSGAGG